MRTIGTSKERSEGAAEAVSPKDPHERDPLRKEKSINLQEPSHQVGIERAPLKRRSRI